MAEAFVVVIWFARTPNPLTTFDIEAVIDKDLESAKRYVSERLEGSRELAWHDGRSFSACEEILPTRHYYTIHTIPRW
jgi:hypothetical protein